MFLLWKRVALFLLLLETVLFGVVYVFGPHGLSMLSQLEETLYTLELKCEDLQQQNEQIQEDIDEWERSAYLKEKVARERLLLKKSGETVYFR